MPCLRYCTFSMDSFLLCLLVFLFATAPGLATGAHDVPWSQNYVILYGQDHTQLLNQEKEIQISIDQASGSGFRSLQAYGSGFFGMRMKLPARDSTGIITTFYLRSHTNNHDEIDFEFLGNQKAPYLLHTNIFTNGEGGREQRINLWFDPTKDFHDYHVLWNRHQVVWFVDGIPIRVFKNNSNIGVKFPVQAMQIEATIWTAPWASPNERPVKWGQGPFQAHYQGFGIDGCVAQNNTISSDQCSGSNFWWNREKYWKLHTKQHREYEHVRKNYLVYDYCINGSGPKPPECLRNK